MDTYISIWNFSFSLYKSSVLLSKVLKQMKELLFCHLCHESTFIKNLTNCIELV